jgi:hypothetical protein
MGPIPTIHHHQNTSYLPYTSTNLQNEGNYDQETNNGQDPNSNKQDQQSYQQDSPRRHKATSPNNTTPTSSSKNPFCMYKEEHVAEASPHVTTLL